MYPQGPAQSVALPRIGQILAGKYELLRVLGEGGMALVYEARHLRLRQRVAIKLLAPELARDPELRARFDHEARAVAKLRTPHIPRVMDVDVTKDDLPFIVMEFLEGRDLDAELAQRKQLPVEEAVDYILQAGAAMMEAHDNGIVHRDLKPANLFLAREGPERILKVLDFGISKVVGEATRLTGAGAVMGTVLYMSPEQIRASKDVDQRADIWSLGVILFELVAGRPPWTGNSHQIAAAVLGEPAPSVRSFVHVPDAFAQVVERMLQRDAGMRVQSMMEAVLALGPYARPDSLGGTLAGQVALGTTGARMRAISSREGRGLKSLTVPMMSKPPHSSGNARIAQVTPTPPPPPAAPTPRAPASDRSLPTKGSGLVAAGIFVGLVGAVGVTLTLAWYWRRTHAPSTETARPIVRPDVVPNAGAGPSSATPSPSQQATTPASGATSTPASAETSASPPPTGTATAPAARRPTRGAAPTTNGRPGTNSSTAEPAAPPLTL
jgi:serine/threonine-protein kinase